AVERLVGGLGEGLAGGLVPLASLAAQPQFGAAALGDIEVAVHGFPATLAGRVEVADLVGRGDLAIFPWSVVDTGMPWHRPPPRQCDACAFGAGGRLRLPWAL